MNRERAGRRVAELVGWSAVAGVGTVMLTQAWGIDGFGLVATAQALTPFGIPVVALVAAGAAWRRSHALAVASAAVGISALLLAAPIVFPAGQDEVRADAQGISAASVNLLYSNPSVVPVADELGRLDPDVIAFSEYTLRHEIALGNHELSTRYPYQINDARPLAGGMALWSKYPLGDPAGEADRSRTIAAEVETPDGSLQVIAVHPPTPVHDHDAWKHSLEALADEAAGLDEPTLILGDFNASYWHPAFRSLLDQGFVDAHIADGDGWSTSWPTDRLLPPFVRLDHALTGNGLVSTEVEDFEVVGGDHSGFVVTVKPAAG
ncbi:endonuclease/exonuclease/phosphatase family protein [Ilumatobacter sp.]|uniref:endonuclease/exonuclease/phosphatase family protein n=1 Tax=Ilumatobacter sp. TaxID=1967498 RepID=UPI003C5FA10B